MKKKDASLFSTPLLFTKEKKSFTFFKKVVYYYHPTREDISRRKGAAHF